MEGFVTAVSPSESAKRAIHRIEQVKLSLKAIRKEIDRLREIEDLEEEEPANAEN